MNEDSQDQAPGLLRMDGSTCIDLLPMEYYARFEVIKGPLYNPAAIDRERVYEVTRIGGMDPASFEFWFDEVNAEKTDGVLRLDSDGLLKVWRPM